MGLRGGKVDHSVKVVSYSSAFPCFSFFFIARHASSLYTMTGLVPSSISSLGRVGRGMYSASSTIDFSSSSGPFT
jgi:hypothetical protein